MEKMFNDLQEKHLNSVVFYGDTSQLKLYYDKEKKQQVVKSDSMYAFERSRVIVKVGDVSHAAVQCGNDGSITILDATSTVTAKKLAVLVK